MRVRLRYFAAVRERMRRDEETLDVPAGTTAGDLLGRVAETHGLGDLRAHLRLAVNREFVRPDRALADGDEVALIPPVAGGGPLVALRADPIDPAEAIAAVAAPHVGAIAVFCGVVRAESSGRRVARLEYEAYREMAEGTLRAIFDEARARWPGLRLTILHRTGSLAVGETAVVVAAATPHRAEAFAACRFAIDAVKERAPIWKKEIGPDGETWAGLDGCGHDRDLA